MPKPKSAATPQPEGDDLSKAFEGLDASEDLDNDVSSLDVDAAGGAEPGSADDPLRNVKYDKGLEGDAKEEMSELLKAFKQQAKGEAQTFEDNTDSEFWCTLVFQNRAQKEAFLQAMGWFKHGDKYLDGRWVAKKQGVTLPDAAPTFNTEEREKKFAALPPVSEAKGKPE